MNRLAILSISFVLAIGLLAACQYDPNNPLDSITKEKYDSLMNMSYYDFDQTAEGWRQYTKRPELQIALIRSYIRQNQSDEMILRWHLGQIYAMQGEYELAVDNLKSCMTPTIPDQPSSGAWNYYVQGTLAFLQRDLETLSKYTDSLENHTETMNIEVLKRLRDHFEKTYKEAYSGG